MLFDGDVAARTAQGGSVAGVTSSAGARLKLNRPQRACAAHLVVSSQPTLVCLRVKTLLAGCILLRRSLANMILLVFDEIFEQTDPFVAA